MSARALSRAASLSTAARSASQRKPWSAMRIGSLAPPSASSGAAGEAASGALPFAGEDGGTSPRVAGRRLRCREKVRGRAAEEEGAIKGAREHQPLEPLPRSPAEPTKG